jgi:hypothetical protein
LGFSPAVIRPLPYQLKPQFDHQGFEAPAPVGHPGRVSLPEGHPTSQVRDELAPRLPGR